MQGGDDFVEAFEQLLNRFYAARELLGEAKNVAKHALHLHRAVCDAGITWRRIPPVQLTVAPQTSPWVTAPPEVVVDLARAAVARWRERPIERKRAIERNRRPQVLRGHEVWLNLQQEWTLDAWAEDADVVRRARRWAAAKAERAAGRGRMLDAQAMGNQQLRAWLEQGTRAWLLSELKTDAQALARAWIEQAEAAVLRRERALLDCEQDVNEARMLVREAEGAVNGAVSRVADRLRTEEDLLEQEASGQTRRNSAGAEVHSRALARRVRAERGERQILAARSEAMEAEKIGHKRWLLSVHEQRLLAQREELDRARAVLDETSAKAMVRAGAEMAARRSPARSRALSKDEIRTLAAAVAAGVQNGHEPWVMDLCGSHVLRWRWRKIMFLVMALEKQSATKPPEQRFAFWKCIRCTNPVP